MKRFLSSFSPRYIPTIVYMLQATEYKVSEYRAWLKRVKDFRAVNRRRRLDYTAKAKLLLLALMVFYGLVVLGLAGWVWLAPSTVAYVATPLILLALPWLASRLVMVPLWAGRVFIQLPKEKKVISAAGRVLKRHPGFTVAIAGSYGKTTAKEVLKEVLGASRKVAATPGNMNTAIGISRFARRLKGDEEVLIIELGEERPGDVAMLCRLAQPDAGFITGISAAHLSSFGTMEQVTNTIFEIKDYLGDRPLYVNEESEYVTDKVAAGDVLYSRKGAKGWSVSDVHVSIEGTRFTVTKGAKKVQANTRLLGAHTIGVVVAAIALADELGLKVEEIEAGVSRVKPFEHRMEPRQLGGAWVIDDTYNGNIAGVRAGLGVLKALEAKRKIYVTPGLVEQGDLNEAIHTEIGKLIAAADVNEAVLMRNSVTEYIQQGLQNGGFTGKVILVDDPLTFYSNLDQYIAHGDVVLMQNDWTDNYN